MRTCLTKALYYNEIFFVQKGHFVGAKILHFLWGTSILPERKEALLLMILHVGDQSYWIYSMAKFTFILAALLVL